MIVTLVFRYLELCEQLLRVVIAVEGVPVNAAGLIEELSSETMSAWLSHTDCRWCRCGLNLTRYGFLLVLCDHTLLSSNFNRDVSIFEAVTVNGQVLTTTGVALVCTDVRDGWHVHSLIAPAHVVGAVSCLMLSYHCVADLPQHFNVLVVADWHLTYLAHDFVVIPVVEGVIIIDEKFVVKF